MTEIAARQLLTPLRPSMEDFFYADWNMNLYRGCTHGCIYCDTRSVCYRVEDFGTVRPKANALTLLEAELRAKRRTGVISMGAMSDPYNPLEADLRLTRGALELIRRYRFGVTLTTKSDLCARDADILADIARHAPVSVRLTVTCQDDGLCRKIEPDVSPTSRRLEAVRTLASAGILTGVWVNPVLPFITDNPENILGVLRLSADAGAKYAVCFFGMTLRTGNREYFFDALERDFPGLRRLYLTAFGNAYECPSPRAQELYQRFTAECGRLGLHWRFADINRAMLARQPRQTSLFDP